MADKKFTPEQEEAINTKEKSLLVSAAAGSGKTATLTERIIRSLTRESEPEDISRMLIVTFTNAAVGELRERISGAIMDALMKNPENKNLERQLMLLPMAKICTIDSFCNEILKRNSDKVGIPSNYRIADGAETEILSYAILEALIDALYENELPELCSAKEFAYLADALTSSKKNSELEEIFLKLYEKSKSSVEGVRIFRRLAESYAQSDPVDNEYTSYILKLICDTAEHFKTALFSELRELSSGSASEAGYADIVSKDIALIEPFLSVKSYSEAKSLLNSLEFARLPAIRGEKTPAQEETFILRSAMKEEFKILKTRFFFYSEEEWRELFKGLSSQLILLAKFLEEFDRIYTQEKKRRLMLEYSDIERYAYLSLYNSDGEPSDFARSLAEEFTSVYIDEYQDVNALQNKIFDAVSKKNNRFMVGDIKQSIYGFRNADPDIFASMKKSLPPNAKSEGSDSASIFMSKNFRCDEGIVDFVNGIFDKVFGITAESIGYLSDDRLDFGKLYEGNKPEYRAPKFILIPSKQNKSENDDYDGEDENEGSGKRRELECEIVARKIAEILKNGRLNDGSEPRPSDIAIILRGNRQRMSDYAEALSRLGIPSQKADDRNFFLNSEVLLALCLLNSIDNPKKDIYLAGLMSSPLYGFTADELFLLRNKRSGSLYDSLRSFTEENPDFEKGRDFLDKLDFYRTLSEGMNVDTLILRLYNDTGLLPLAERNGGKENLLLLYNYAKSFSASSFKGLYNFIKFINNIIERGTQFDAKRDGDEKDAVNILTVHASKGLEYPIVFYVDTDTALKDKETRDRVAFSEKFGLSMRLRSPGGLALVENPVHNTVLNYKARKYFEEELRVIYVALTRAREDLYIVGCIPEDYEKYLEKTELDARFLDSYSIYKSKSPLDLMLSAKDTGEIIITDTYSDPETTAEAPETEERKNGAKDAEAYPTTEELKLRFEFEYPNAHLTKLPEKLSVSRLTPEVLDGSEEEEPLLTIERAEVRAEKRGILPEFVTGTRADESARRGIATHNFLQFFNIEGFDSNGAEAELLRLYNDGFISKENKERVRINEIELFGESAFYAEMKSAKRLFREFRFNTRLPAKFFTLDEEKKKALANEELLVQGVIDCLIEDENGDFHLADYKTDRLTKAELADKELAKQAMNTKHALQLSYYCLAVKKIFGKEPKSVRVYSLPLGDTVDIDRIKFE